MANVLYSACSGKDLSEMIINRGPDSAFVHLYDLYNIHMFRKIVYFLIRCQCCDPRSHGQDIRQLTWNSVNNDIRNYSLGKKDENYVHPYNFVTTIWRRLSIKHLEYEKRNPIMDIDEAGFSGSSSKDASVDRRILPVHFVDPQAEIETQEKIEFAKRAFKELSEDEKEIIIQFHFDEMTHLQIGRKLGISAVAARKRYSRALRDLRLKYREAGG